jgi:hypothetical protein
MAAARLGGGGGGGGGGVTGLTRGRDGPGCAEAEGGGAGAGGAMRRQRSSAGLPMSDVRPAVSLRIEGPADDGRLTRQGVRGEEAFGTGHRANACR